MVLKMFKKRDVPDELPSLDEKRKEVRKEEKLAPDELSPIKSSIRFEKKEDKTEEPEEESEEDSELYFSKVMKKINDEKTVKAEEIIHPKSKDIINTLDSYWETKKNTTLLEDVERKINEKIVYLEELEEEWRHVKNEINDKEIVLGHKEMDIKENTEALKQLINEKAMLKSKLGKRPKTK